jgi:hypothetical protein
VLRDADLGHWDAIAIAPKAPVSTPTVFGDDIDTSRDIRPYTGGVRHRGRVPGWPIYVRLIWFFLRHRE